MTGEGQNTTARGYGWKHQQARARVARQVAAGTATCARCGYPIDREEAWDLDHSDDRAGYLGPSHARCNRATNGRRRPRVVSTQSVRPRRVVVVPPDDPENHIYWGPPDDVTGQPRRWSRRWFEWR